MKNNCVPQELFKHRYSFRMRSDFHDNIAGQLRDRRHWCGALFDNNNFATLPLAMIPRVSMFLSIPASFIMKSIGRRRIPVGVFSEQQAHESARWYFMSEAVHS